MERNNSHLAGEYFVAAELYRRGFTVGMTIGNAKALDILAVKGYKSFKIQVKAIFNDKSVGWPMQLHKVIPNVYYIFVNLNGDKYPEYYIATSRETYNRVKQYYVFEETKVRSPKHQKEKKPGRGIIEIKKFKRGNYLNNWNKLS